MTACLLYTSDAADDLLCVDPGGRRSITKKKLPHVLIHRCPQHNTNTQSIYSLHTYRPTAQRGTMASAT